MPQKYCTDDNHIIPPNLNKTLKSGQGTTFYEPADKILFLVPKKQVFGWWSDVYLVVDQSKFVDLVRQIISEQSDEVDISKKTRLGSLVYI